MRVGAPLNRFKTPGIITDRPKAVLCCSFLCFMFGAVHFLKVLILTLLCVSYYLI